ncbi:hypothetical protein FN846DRAFT_762528, partial [Sphaerosporella brunnea]
RTAAFRIAVEKRDLACILTGSNNHPPFVDKRKEMLCGPAIEAAHIIPLGRPDLWKTQIVADIRMSRRKLRIECGKIDQNALENGVMLRADLHCMFDRFFWGVHPKTWRVVVFIPVPELVSFHGRRITRRVSKQFPPEPVWLWHWQQCVLRCFRAGGELPETKYYDPPQGEALRVPCPDETAE